MSFDLTAGASVRCRQRLSALGGEHGEDRTGRTPDGRPEPKVRRTDAIQSFVSQETPIVTITDADGATGTGYSYTIGTGGSSVMRLLADHLAPRLIGRDADQIEAIWHELEFATHATTIGAHHLDRARRDRHGALGPARPKARAAALEARRRRQGSLPALHDRGRLAAHRDRGAGRRCAARPRRRASAAPRSRSAARTAPRTVARLSAVRKAVGDGYEIMTDCNQGFTVDEAIRRAERLRALDLAWIEEPLAADDIDGHVRLSTRHRHPVAVGESLYSIRHFREYMQRGGCSHRPGRCRADRRHHAVAQGGACRGGLRHACLPALPDGAACQPGLRHPERQATSSTFPSSTT